jgi:flagellar biosynthesis chaperone FliJ
LKNNHQKSIQTLQHTETFVSNLNNNILIYKKELDALTNKVAELEKNHQKSMRTLQHTETFVSNLSKNIVNYKKELPDNLVIGLFSIRLTMSMLILYSII